MWVTISVAKSHIFIVSKMLLSPAAGVLARIPSWDQISYIAVKCCLTAQSFQLLPKIKIINSALPPSPTSVHFVLPSCTAIPPPISSAHPPHIFSALPSSTFPNSPDQLCSSCSCGCSTYPQAPTPLGVLGHTAQTEGGYRSWAVPGLLSAWHATSIHYTVCTWHSLVHREY